jgi:hypothetical protein
MFFKAELCRHLSNEIAGDCTKLAAEQNARIRREFIFGVQLHFMKEQGSCTQEQGT